MADGRLGLLDFGATVRLDAFEHASITAMLGALREGDPVQLRESVFEVAVVRRDVNVVTGPANRSVLALTGSKVGIMSAILLGTTVTADIRITGFYFTGTYLASICS